MEVMNAGDIVGKLAVAKDMSYSGFKPGDAGLIVEQGVVPVRGYGDHIKVLIADMVVNSTLAYWYVVRDNSILQNKSFCITGPLKYNREFYASVIRLCGGEFKTAVTKNLSYLVTNENRLTTKRKAAYKNKVPVITEQDLLKMLGCSDWRTDLA